MTIFDWCMRGDHENCSRTFERFIIDPRKNTVVPLGEHVTCACRKRGCKCYVKPADRVKTKKRKRKP